MINVKEAFGCMNLTLGSDSAVFGSLDMQVMFKPWELTGSSR